MGTPAFDIVLKEKLPNFYLFTLGYITYIRFICSVIFHVLKKEKLKRQFFYFLSTFV